MEISERPFSSDPPIPRALTIAGSDSGGCAGVQADLKTFAALGVHGMTAITCVTAQNTVKVKRAEDLPTELLAAQIDAVLEDIGADAVKTGMLGSSAIIGQVAASVLKHEVEKLVVDPVMVSTGGDPLLQEDAVRVLKERLFPLAYVITPNLYEAGKLVGKELASRSDIRAAAETLHRLGPDFVIIKGGHGKTSSVATDLMFDGKCFSSQSVPRINTKNTHGGGCTFAAAIAAFLAWDYPMEDAFRLTKEFVTEAIRHSFDLGSGNGPVGHFFGIWRSLGGARP